MGRATASVVCLVRLLADVRGRANSCASLDGASVVSYGVWSDAGSMTATGASTAIDGGGASAFLSSVDSFARLWCDGRRSRRRCIALVKLEVKGDPFGNVASRVSSRCSTSLHWSM